MTARSGSVAIVHPSLALCNTVGPDRDDLETCECLAHWYVAAGLADDPPDVNSRDLAAVRALRDGMRTALLEADAPGVARLAEEWLEGAPGCLCVDSATLEPRFTPADSTPRCLMVAAVLDALALARDARGRVRACAAPDCGALYVDSSRNGIRRWCSMERCGARAKASAYYRRHRRENTAGD
ncbi:MAG: CGNR zinc finger domain-containing protein [Thermoleophilia bacterium]|jgi:predicted RNA-binding Zn ribbon-like protein